MKNKKVQIVAFIVFIIIIGMISYKFGFNYNNSSKPKVDSKNLVIDASKVSGGVNLSWKIIDNNAIYGFRLLKDTTPDPSYPDSDSVYLSNSKTRGYIWNIKDSNSYHFRVCVVNSKKECIVYSNDILVNF